MNEMNFKRKMREEEVFRPIIYSEAYTKVLSRAISLRLNDDSKKTLDDSAVENAVFHVVREYGTRNLVLAPKEDDPFSTVVARNSMKISKDLYKDDPLLLVDQDVSISLTKFLRLYLGLEPFLGDVPESLEAFAEEKKKRVSDLSDIPVEKLSDTYEKIIWFISHLLSVYSCKSGAKAFYISS